jgi:nanoRNase/pAp phosphatase (c-di-AMP/oligoRNAs hydrolase)
LGIENGGGHPGAVGFRIPRDQVVDVIALTDGFARRIDEMAAEVSRA